MAALVAGMGAGVASGAEPPKGKAPPFDPAARAAAAQKGLGWLEKNALGLPESQGTPTRPFTLAFVGLDVLLDAGEYAPSGARARLLAGCRAQLATYLQEVERRTADPAELPDAYGVADSRKLVQYVWPLSLSAWLLSECVARDLDAPAARAQLKRIAKVLEEAQFTDGGWGHGRLSRTPDAPKKPAGATGLVLSGYPPTLLAPTNCAATAMGVLDAALPRPASASAKRAVDHYRACILANGNFPYDLRQRTADQDLTGVGRTAGALVALHALGVPHDDDTFTRGAAFLRQHWDLVGEGHGSPVLNLVFGALAARLLGPEAVVAFETSWIPPVLAKQAPDGALDCACAKRLFGSTCDSPSEHGGGIEVFERGQRAYVTALTTFVLLLEKGRLKVFVPGGPVRRPGAVTPR
jgi:hypothetical protein